MLHPVSNSSQPAIPDLINAPLVSPSQPTEAPSQATPTLQPTATMGTTPSASSLAHVALIPNPVQSAQSTRAPPTLIPIMKQPSDIPASTMKLFSQLNPWSAMALHTPRARLHSQLGPGSALPVEANAASLLVGAGTCPLPDPICIK